MKRESNAYCLNKFNENNEILRLLVSFYLNSVPILELYSSNGNKTQIMKAKNIGAEQRITIIRMLIEPERILRVK